MFNIVSYDLAWAVRTPLELSGDVSNRSGGLGFIKELHPDTFTLPEYFGHIKDSYRCTSDKIVIHIQDAHCNYAAQHKISEIIEYLNEEYGIGTVNLEGGARDYDLSIFTDIADKSIRDKVADHFVKEGLVNGAESFAINNPDKLALWGIEDTGLYIDNLRAYQESLKHKGEVDQHLSAITHILNNLKTKIYSQELLDLDIKYSQYKAGGLEFKTYLSYLIEIAKEKIIDVKSFKNIYLLNQALTAGGAIDFKKANSQRDDLIDRLQKRFSKNEIKELVLRTVEFKSEKISQKDFYGYIVSKAKSINLELNEFPELQKYIVYISTYDTIDKIAVMSEVDSLENRTKEILYRNDDERELSKLSKNLALIKNLFNISLTPDDYKYYKANEGSFETRNYRSFINRQAPLYHITAKLDESVTNLDAYRVDADKFYDCSFKRDAAFIKNLVIAKPVSDPTGRRPRREGLKRSKIRAAILITGGFHTENLYNMFKKRGISYISIMPNFKNDPGYECPYFKLLSGEKALKTNLAIPDPLNPSIMEAIKKDGLSVPGLSVQNPEPVMTADAVQPEKSMKAWFLKTVSAFMVTTTCFIIHDAILRILPVDFYSSIFIILGGPIFEELFYRKIIFRYLLVQKMRLTTCSGLWFSNIAFALQHSEYGYIMPLYALMYGYLFSFIYIKTKNILYPILAHITVNAIVAVMWSTGYGPMITIGHTVIGSCISLLFFIPKKEYYQNFVKSTEKNTTSSISVPPNSEHSPSLIGELLDGKDNIITSFGITQKDDDKAILIQHKDGTLAEAPLVKDVRNAFDAIKEKATEPKHSGELIRMLEEVMKNKDFVMSSNRSRDSPMTNSEKDLIRWNFKNDKTGKKVLFGVQDLLSPEGNARFAWGIRNLNKDLRQGVLNIFLMSSKIDTKSAQTAVGREAGRKLEKHLGVNTQILYFEDNLDEQLAKAIEKAMMPENKDKLPKIFVDCLTEDSWKKVKDFKDSKRQEFPNINDIIAVGRDFVEGQKSIGLPDEVKIILVGNVIMNDRRLKDDFKMSAADLLESRKGIIDFLVSNKIIDGVTVADDQIDAFFNDLWKGVKSLLITKINWKEFQDWKNAQDEVLRAL